MLAPEELQGGVFLAHWVWLHVTLHNLNAYRTGYCMTWFNPGFWHVKRDSELIFLKHISLGPAIHYKHIEPCWRSKTIKRFSFGKKIHFHANINFLIVYSSNITAAQRLYSCLLCSWQLMMIKMYNAWAGPPLVWKGLNLEDSSLRDWCTLVKVYIFNNNCYYYYYSPKAKFILVNNPWDEVEGIIQQY